MKFTGIIRDGKVLLSDAKLYMRAVADLEGKSIQLELKKLQLDFTEQQNNFYWGVIIRKYCMENSQFAGWTEREIDSYLGSELRVERIKLRKFKSETNSEQTSIIPISRLKKDEYSQFIENAIIFLALEHDIVIHDKNPEDVKEN